MSATRQGMSFARIEHIVTQRIANDIEAIAVYETKIRMDYELMDHVVRQEAKVAKNTNKKQTTKDRDSFHQWICRKVAFLQQVQVAPHWAIHCEVQQLQESWSYD
nr:hypothetical protein [Tanacetum cinerariifolium]